jgi:hypothetical protein
MMVQTKYGTVNSDLKTYVDKVLVGKIYKLLPLREEKNATLPECHESLMYELHGGGKLIADLQMHQHFLSLICSLEGLLLIEDDKAYRRKVFECINICKSLV